MSYSNEWNYNDDSVYIPNTSELSKADKEALEEAKVLATKEEQLKLDALKADFAKYAEPVIQALLNGKGFDVKLKSTAMRQKLSRHFPIRFKETYRVDLTLADVELHYKCMDKDVLCSSLSEQDAISVIDAIKTLILDQIKTEIGFDKHEKHSIEICFDAGNQHITHFYVDNSEFH